MRTLVALFALGAVAIAQEASQDERARELLQKEVATLERRALDLREQVDSLPRESLLREEKVRQVRHLELDLQILGEKLRGLAPRKAAPAADGPSQVRLQEVRLLESRYATKARVPAVAEGESLWLRLTVGGLQRKEADLAFGFDVRLLTPAGKAVMNVENASKGDVEDQYDCRSFTSFIGLGNLRGVIGKFTLEVTAHDRNSGLKDVWKTDIEIRKPDFGVYNPYFSADEEGKHEVPPAFPLGGQRYVHFKALGFSAQGGQLHLGDGFEVYDDRMNRLYSQEGSAEGVKGRVPEDWTVAASRKVNSVKPGSYVLRLIVVDRLTGTRTHRDVPFRVLPDRDY